MCNCIKNKKDLQCFCIELIIILGICAIVACFSIYPTIKNFQYTEQVKAFKIEVVKSHFTEDGTFYYTIYHYKVSNITYKCKSFYCSNEEELKKKISVLYTIKP